MIHPVLRLMLAASLATTASHAAAAPMRCDWASRQQCDPSGPCRPINNRAWSTIDLKAGRLQRCDPQGCDTYKALLTPSGLYTLAEVPGRGLLLKVSADGHATHVASIMNTVIVYQGRCR